MGWGGGGGGTCSICSGGAIDTNKYRTADLRQTLQKDNVFFSRYPPLLPIVITGLVDV